MVYRDHGFFGSHNLKKPSCQFTDASTKPIDASSLIVKKKGIAEKSGQSTHRGRGMMELEREIYGCIHVSHLKR